MTSGHFAISRRVLWALLACQVSACMVGPDYQRPELAAPAMSGAAAGPAEAPAPADALVLESLAWADLLREHELQQLIRTALENNKDLQMAVARVEQSRALNRIASAGRLPSVELQQRNERESESALTNEVPEQTDELFFGPALAWEVDLWGRQRRLSNAGYAHYLAAEYGAQAIRLSLVSEVALAYFELQGERARVQISRDTLAARERSLAIAERRFKGGLTSRLEYTQAQVDLAATRSALVRVVQLERLAQNRLSLLLGEPPGTRTLQKQLDELYLPAEITAELSSSLLDRRPDIMQAEQLAIAASEEVGVATANLLPNVMLTASGGTETTEFADLLDPAGEYWIVNLDLVMPLFNAGARRASLTVAEHRYNEARLQWEQALLTALREVADGLVRFRQAGAALEAEMAFERASQDYLNLAYKRYRNGVLAYIDVLDAQRSLFVSQIAVSQARQARLSALVSLYKALGGGWDQDKFTAVVDEP